VGIRTALDAVAKKKNFSPCQKSNRGNSDRVINGNIINVGLTMVEFFYSPLCPERLWAHSASYPMGIRGSFLGDKAAKA